MKKLLIAVLALLPLLAHAELEITISGGRVSALPIAVAPFAVSGDVPVDVAQVVEDDLARSGLFRPIPRSDMLERPSQFSEVDLRNWRTLGAEHLVIGKLIRGGGSYKVQFFLIDVFRGEQTLAYEMPAPAKPEQLRYTAHDIADLIYEKLTGIRGYFNTQIAYVTASGAGDQRVDQLIVADADGYNPRVLLRSKDPILSPAWSPDKRKLAYVAYDRGNSAVYIHDRISGEVTKLVSEKGINGAPSWSPDGRKLALTMSFESNPDIYVVDIATRQRQRITDHWAIDTEPDWSPDGQNLVFTSDRGGQPQVYQVSASGGEARRLTFDGRQNLRARYSPDGEKLALVNYSESGYRIGLFDLKTRELRLLGDGPLDESPTFAPNGQVVMYATSGPRGAELATVSVDGRVRQRLRQAGDVREPAWSPFASPSRNN